MRTLIGSEYGSLNAFTLTEGEIPQPTEGEVRLKVEATALGFVDGLIALGRYQIRPPLPWNDGAVVVARASGRADPRGREQVVRAHEPQHPALGRANARHAQPGPDLAVTLAVKRAGGQDRADRVDQGRIRHRPNRARTPRRVGPGGGEMPIHAGPRGAPDRAHGGQAIGPAT